MPALDVLAIGNALVDIASPVPDVWLTTHGVVKGAMNLVDEPRAESLYAAAPPGTEMSGGSAANTAAGVASLGGQAAFIGKVRNDQLGKIFRHDLTSLGVQFATPAAETGPTTGRCLCLITPDAQRSMNTFLGACENLSPTDISETDISRSKMVYLEGYPFDLPGPRQALQQAATLARKHGTPLAMTLSDGWLVDRHRDLFKTYLQQGLDVLFANEQEILTLFPSANVEDAVRDAAKYAKLVACTRSGAGAVLMQHNVLHHVPAEKVDQLIDTTGAGDMFAAGFLYGMTQNMPLEAAARLGHRCAAQIIQHYGPRPQTPLSQLK